MNNHFREERVFKFPIQFTLCGTMEIRARSLKEAIEKAYIEESLPNYSECDYLTDSFRVENMNGEFVDEYTNLEDFEKNLQENNMITPYSE